MRCPKWVTAQDIDRWAATPQAKSLLPELIRRLVFATILRKDVKKIDFPSGAEFQRPGYDGTTVVTQGTQFVPEGVCFWELGCDVNNPKGKAQDDYDKRIEEHKERVTKGETENLGEVTYIAVSAPDWLKCEGWVKERNEDHHFKEVRAYDSNRLEHWLQETPAVALWLAQEIHGKRDGVIDISEHWANVQATLQRPLLPKVLLVDRDGIKIAFSEWLNQPNNELAVKAPSAAELVATFCAWVESLAVDEQNAISSRTIIVESRETWRALATSTQPLILIASPRLDSDAELFAEAVRKGHHVLRPADFRALPGKGGIELAMMRRFDLQKALEESGLQEIEARRLAEAAGGNFTILRRRFAKTINQPPGWSDDGNLAPLLLAAAWEDKRPDDQRIISELAEKKYSNVQILLHKWRQTPDAPIRLILGMWEFLSPIDAWEALHPFLNSTQMDRFEKIAVEVLSEDNPALDLLPSERFMALVKGKKWKFSQNLRQGIAEILALGAARADDGAVGLELNFSARAASIVKRLLPEGCNWKRWASLGHLLPLIIEAAPEVVLSTIEHDISSDNSQIVELLRQEVPGGIIGAAYHSGLLWALETAAWSEKYVQRVSLCLTQLTKLDPSGQWANRPKGSAGGIFFYWRPQTVATVRERIRILQYLCKKEPAGAWKLVLSLFPEAHGSFMDSAKPSFRDWAAGWTGKVSESDYDLFLAELAKLAVELVNANPELWPELLDRITRFPAGGFANAIATLEKFSMATMSPDIRLKLWEKLRKFLQEHTYFRDSWWALPAAELARLRVIADRLAPTDFVITSKYLFDDDGHMEGDKDESFEDKQARRLKERCSAIRSIWKNGGISSVVELSTKVRQPWTVGMALAQELGDDAHAEIIPSLFSTDKDSVAKLAAAFAANQIHLKGVDWAEAQPNNGWSADQIAAWALNMPFEPRTWDWVALKGSEIEKKYWSRTGVWGSKIDAKAGERAAKQLQSVGRAWSALEHLNMAMHSKVIFSPEVICNALDVIASSPAERNAHSMDAYHVQEAFVFLHKSTDIDESRIARLEFAFLPFLDKHSRCPPQTLHRQLAREPDFFVDCLKLLYNPRGASEKEKPPADSAKAERASRIWHLLRDWQTIPGSDAAGVISLDALRTWVQTARQKAKEADRLEVCDLTLGELFARGSEDVDQAKPPVAIREIIEECESDKLEQGFSMGLHNLRGVVSKSLYEGGKQERELEVIFQRYAEICSKWPRTSAALREVAEDYNRQAEVEDERAKVED
jgi:hypothetical protein